MRPKSKVKFRDILIISGLIHLLALSSCPGTPKSSGEQQQNRSSHVTVDILEKPDKSQGVKQKIDECPHWFGGVGMYFFGKSVSRVVRGYPAQKSGIKEGDKVISPLSDIRGEVGSPVTIVVSREGQLMRFDLIREKICLTGEEIGNRTEP